MRIDVVEHRKRPGPRGLAARRRARHLREAFLVVIVGALTMGVFYAAQYATARRAGPPERGPRFLIEDELAIKVDLAERLSYTPQVFLLGGSRGLRFEPSYITKRTGLRAFNACIRNGRPEEAYGFVNYLHDRFPTARPRFIWMIHVKVLRGWWRVSPTLILDPRLSRYFPDSFLRAQDKYMPHSPEDLPPKPKLPPPRWADDGHILWSHSDTFKSLGFALNVTINQWFRKNGPGSPTIEPRPKAYFEKTLARMNELGARPVLVMMPVHPTVLTRIGPGGFWQSHHALTRHLGTLKDRYGFTLVDLTSVATFGGDPDDFYDGYHPKTANTRRMIDEILRRYPHALD